jgi:putative oxidoreductase
MNSILINRTAKIIVAFILLQTLYFKFTGSPESVFIFTKLGAEPFGRISSGIIELFASVFLFVNKTKFYAAFIALSTMFVAIVSHLFIIGIEVENDGGTLFFLACITFILSLFLAFRYKNDINFLIK